MLLGLGVTPGVTPGPKFALFPARVWGFLYGGERDHRDSIDLRAVSVDVILFS